MALTVTNPDGTPATLTADEQAEVNQIAPPQTQLLNPYQPHEYTDPEGKPVSLTPSEQADYRKQAGLVDPLLDLSPDDMVSLSRQTADDPSKQFNIFSAFMARKDEISKDPAAVRNVADAWKKYKDSTGLGDLPSAGEMLHTAGKAAYGLADYIGTLFYNYPKRLLTSEGSPANLEATRNLAETAAASETAIQGSMNLVQRLISKLPQPEDIASLPGLSSILPPAKVQKADPVVDLFADASRAEHMQDIVKGQGFLSNPETIEKLNAAGVPLRSEEVENLAAGDPFTLYLFGKAFGAASAAVPGIPESALAAAGRGAAAAGGLAVTGGSKAAQWVIPKVTPFIPTVSAIKGLAEGGPAGLVVGYTAGKEVAHGLTKNLSKLEALESAGRQIAGSEPVKSAYAQLAKDVFQAAPAAAYEVGKGAALDVGLAATAETPEEAKGVGLGTFFGLLGGAGREFSHVLSGQLIAPREWGSNTVIPSNRYFPGLDALHNPAFADSTPGVKTRVNAARAFVRSAIPGGDYFNIPRPESGPDPLIPALEKLGLSTEQATTWAQQDGVTSHNVNGHQLIISRDVESAPHEAKHALEDVLGESVMRQEDRLVQNDPKYSGTTWDAIGQNYAQRLGWDPESGQSWQDHILDVSKWGIANAAEKLARGGQQGPISADEMTAALGKAADTWRTVLTPEEQTEVANRFISREIAAENFDAAFKHGIGADKEIPARLARIVGHFVRYMGGDPLAGRTAEASGYPLSYDVVRAQQAKAQATQAGRAVPELPKVIGVPRAGLPTTPEQQTQAAGEAQALAQGAPTVPPVAGGTKSARELLGTIAEAIAQRTGVKINYLSAPNEPAAATTSNRPARRAMIEAGRTMPPESRSFWEKTFFPERVVQLRDGSYQVLGWSPEVFAANAHRTAGALADMIAKDPANGSLSPYPIDTVNRTFTPRGWQDLFADVQQFVQNQGAGRTGSGVPLVVPKFATDRGLFAPSLQPGAPLEQPKADFISNLFGFKLPETPRITGGHLPLNIAGQEVSAATMPGRVEVPVRPRGTFEGPKAEEQGIEGRQIQEVNPFRNAVEQASKNTGVPLPSLIESVQRLNLNSIKEVAHAPEAPEFRGNTLALTAGFQPPRETAGFVNPVPPKEVPDFRPEEIQGAEVHPPSTSYQEASQADHNPWVRQSATTDNSNRTLLVQMSSDLINPEALAGAKDEATQYYDMLYSGARPGYARLQDFWEIPQWIGFASHFLPDADVYVVRNVDQAKEFFKQAGYKNLAFSALDTNKGLIRDLVTDYPGQVDIGGYVDPKTFEDLPNVQWHNSMESMANRLGVEYKQGVDYRHFQGSDVIPRLTMSQGCRHKCAFCSVPKVVEETPADVVRQQADAIAKLGSKLVYLNDKTFGQAGNYKQLIEINKQVREQNPDFKGFVIQTTAAQLKIMSPEFLRDSGIKFVELGIESYNDPILKAMHKPATESLINQVTGKLRDAGIALIPNIIVGFPQETAETYTKTLDWLKANKDIISHANIYNLALYKDAELGKQIVTGADADYNENVLEKSFHTNPEIHRQFAGDVYGLASQMLEGKPSAAQFQPENVRPLDEIPDTKEKLFPGGLQASQFNPNQDPRAIRTAAVRDPETGRIFEGPMHFNAMTAAMNEGGIPGNKLVNLDHGFLTNENEFLNREDAFKRAQEVKQLRAGAEGNVAAGYTRGLMSEDIRPKAHDIKPINAPPSVEPKVQAFIDHILLTSNDEWVDWAKKVPGGFTAAAHEVGMSAKTMADVGVLRSTALQYEDLTKQALAADNIQRAIDLSSKSQAAREAYESATGTTIKNDKNIRVTLDRLHPGYQPPVPLDEQKAQFSPPNPRDEREQIVSAAVKLENGEVYPGTTHGEAFKTAYNTSDETIRDYQDGFTTTKGRFVSRAEGYKIALASQQMTEKGYEQAEIENFGEPGTVISEPTLESVAFNDARRMQQRRLLAKAKGVPLDSQAQPKTFIVRHGSTSMNNEDPAKDKIRGFQNPALSEAGKQEAKATAEKLAGSDLTMIVTSDLKRARETADEIAKTTGAKVVEDPNLRPWHFGPTIEGKPTKDMLPIISGYVERPNDRPPKGETFNEFKDRFLGAFHKAQADYPDENTAIVTHYRGTKLMDAWRATGVDNDTIDKAVFEKYDPDREPGSFDTVDKTGAEIPAEETQEQFDVPAQFSVRTDDPPKKTIKGYKLMRILPSRPGELFPLFMDKAKPTPMGVWLDADIGKGPMALRPGWHLGDLPFAPHIGQTGPGGEIDRMHPDTVWVEAEVAADTNWQKEANKRAARTKAGKIIPRTAQITDTIPKDGFYRYKTNPSLPGEWIISGAIKLTRILPDSEVDRILTKAGVTPMPREGGPLDLSRAGLDTAQFAAPKDKEWKLKVAKGGMYAYSKGWILPDGTPQMIGGQEHQSWLAENPGVLQKFNVKPLPEGTAPDDIALRNNAIAAGFARINYSINQGSLVVEARQKDWPNLIPAVRQFAEANVNKIDSMTVSLLDAKAQGVKESGTQQLFRFSNKEKMDHLPLISAPSEVTSTSAQGSAQFQPFQAESFDSELEKIRKSSLGGQTFDTEGNVWTPPAAPSDLVSLASVNVPLGQLTREAVTKALAPYADLLDEPGVTAGVFAFSKDGKPTVSIDINAVVSQKHRKNTLDFAKQNDQVAIWDAHKGEEVSAGGKGETKLQSLGEIYDALRPLQSGKPVDVASIQKENRQTEVAQPELGMDLPKSNRPLTPSELANMTKADIAARYPESVVPRTRDEPVPSEITKSPLFKAAGTRENAVKAFARKLVEFAKEHQDHPAFQSGLRWYSEFVPKLKKIFGSDAPIMAELLAGTSPNTNPEQNYAMAEDALARYKAGKFEPQIKKFEEGLAKFKNGSWEKWIADEIAAGNVENPPATPSAETFLNHWVDKFNLKPRKANGKLYGISSDAVLKILARRWLANTPGLKTQNFVKNLLGTGHEATIDLWADRTMRRVGYSGSKERWRILPKNATGVSDEDFLFAQDAFREAAKELGMRPSSLQGGLWFAEKQLWANQGWGKLDLGDYRTEIKKTEAARKSKQPKTEQLGFDIVEPR